MKRITLLMSTIEGLDCGGAVRLTARLDTKARAVLASSPGCESFPLICDDQINDSGSD